MDNNTISFWQFLNQHVVEIPIIQRDYAQGRTGKEHIRKQFLTQLKSALDGDKQHTTLDFIYGNVEQYQETEAFCPLDGQQRLTTLWLLHWYIALRSGNLNEYTGNILQRFTYETRTSSREFCKALCVMNLNVEHGVPIVEHIQQQTWFFSQWKQDPTIQSMLRMLNGTTREDGIEGIFNCDRDTFTRYWNKLIVEACPITFYKLKINSNEMPISDDIYIKMNARGKQLSDFENFKADLIDWMRMEEREDKTLDSVEIAKRIDNEWTDIFWNSLEGKGKIDDIFFAFINRYFLNAYIINHNNEKSSEFDHLYSDKDDHRNIEYQGFDVYEKIVSKDLIHWLSKTFENLNGIDNLNSYFPDWVKKDTFSFIPGYHKDGVTTLTQSQRVVFHAICKYFEYGAFDECSFRQWMRIVWNIVENASINSIAAMNGHIRLIDELSRNAHDIYSYLLNLDLSALKSKASKEQLEEEITKVKQIISGNWENKILTAEGHAFFNGAIRFLFTDSTGAVDWNDFDIKYEHAKAYFNNDGVTSAYFEEAKLLRRLLVYFTDWSYFYEITYDSKHSTWKDLLLNKSLIDPVHHLLLNDDIHSYDYISFISHNRDFKQKYAKEYLVRNTALSRMVLECRMHYRSDWCNGSFVLYPSNVKADWKKYIIHPRIDILCDNAFTFKDAKLEEYRKDKLLWGVNINFKYEDHYFQWWGTPNEKELDVYLMEDDEWKIYKRRPEKLKDNVTDYADYYCFEVAKDETIDSFKCKLDDLINQSNNIN